MTVRGKFFHTVVVALLLLVASPALGSPAAQRHSRNGGTSRSSSPRIRTYVPRTRSSSAQRTVHVRTYTRKDGTVVAAHNRAAPRARTTTATTETETRSTSRSTTSRTSTSSSARTARTTARPPTAVRRADRCTNCDRDSRGRIVRSTEAKDAFERATGYPHGRPGYVIDHIVPLACGGADSPSNMQWQTVTEAKAKDKVERNGCGR